MKRTIKEILKSSIAKVVGLALVVGMSVSILTACGQQTNNGGKTNPTKTETDKEKDPKQEIIVNPTDPEKEDPTPEDPGKEDPEPENPENPEQPGKEDPEPEDPKPEDPTDPGKEDPTPDDPQPEDPEDPKPEDPDDPQTEDPQDEELDFSALEAKLEEVILAKHRNSVLNEIISYSLKDGKMILLYDYSNKTGTVNNVVGYEVSVSVNEFKSQSDIDTVINNISKENFSSSSFISFAKTSSDITVNGVTYSKDGIEGDNIFAEQCGVENAVMTYVSSIAKPHLNSQSRTNYSSGYNTLVVYKNNNSINVRLQGVSIECQAGDTEEQVLKLSFEDKAYVGGELTLSDPIDLGENLKPQPEIQAYNAAWMFESEEEIDYVQDALDYVYENIETFKIKETR